MSIEDRPLEDMVYLRGETSSKRGVGIPYFYYTNIGRRVCPFCGDRVQTADMEAHLLAKHDKGEEWG